MKPMLLPLLTSVTLLAAGCSTGETEKDPQPAKCASKRLSHDYIVQWRDGGSTRVRTRNIDDWLSSRSADILAIEPNYLLERAEPIADAAPVAGAPEEIQRALGLDYAWDRAILGNGITVAVIDTGVDLEQPFLKEHFLVNDIELKGTPGVDDDGNGFVDDIHGWNVTADSATIVDELGHGTSVAGLIAGPLRNGVSVAVAPGAKILPVDFIVGETGTEYDAKKGIDYALARKVNIINNSWSIPCSDFLKNSFAGWALENVLFVNAAGNERIDVTRRGAIPSSLVAKNFLNVGSVNRAGTPSDFSGFGTSVGLFALGEELPILGRSLAGEGQPTSSGTSLSAAIVSGAAALLWSARPELTAAEVAELLVRGGTETRSNTGSTKILNLGESIERARRL